jgi:hypothetical protein
MHVFVTIADLESRSRIQDMGQLPEHMTLWNLREMCLVRVAHQLETGARELSRHFWYNGELLPYKQGRTLIRDITQASSVWLELRPDYYYVQCGRRPPQIFAIDLELTTAEVIALLLAWMGQRGNWQCYELAVHGKKNLTYERSLLEQGILPSLGTPLNRQSEVLVLRSRRTTLYWKAALLAAGIGLGFAIGYMIR